VVEGGHGGHHGGAWKVAYADFVTAMMAFFLLLWLISSASEETLKGLSEYFSDASVNIGTQGGVGGMLHGVDVVPNPNVPAPSSPLNVQPTVPFSQTEEESDSRQVNLAEGADGIDRRLSDEAFEAERERREQAAFEAAEEGIREALEATPELRRFKENLAIDHTPEGLRIQILDREKSAMFPVGSDQMYGHTRKLLEVVARAVADLPNRVSVRGHTDSLAFAGRRLRQLAPLVRPGELYQAGDGRGGPRPRPGRRGRRQGRRGSASRGRPARPPQSPDLGGADSRPLSASATGRRGVSDPVRLVLTRCPKGQGTVDLASRAA
jgi:chemotaxis protein MotB